MSIYAECGHVVVANEKECSQCLGKRALAWIRQYAMPALDGIRCYSVSTSNGSQCCYPDEEHLPDCPIGQALANLPEGVRLDPKEE